MRGPADLPVQQLVVEDRGRLVRRAVNAPHRCPGDGHEREERRNGGGWRGRLERGDRQRAGDRWGETGRDGDAGV